MRFIKSAIKYFNILKDRNDPDYESMIPFVKSLPSCTSIILDEEFVTSNRRIPDSFMDKEFYLPFKVCCFEIPIPKYQLNNPDESFDGWQRNTGFDKPIAIGQMLIENDDFSLDKIMLIFQGEIEKECWLENMNYIPKNIMAHTYHYNNYEEFNNDVTCKAALYMLHSKLLVFGETARAVKFKKSGLLPEMVKKIVVVSPIRKISEVKDIDGYPIEWKHSWSVMGHWRRINPTMLGKDRSGEYVIVGRTWVADHIKGDGPFVQKTRVKKGEACQELTKQ